MKCHVTVFFFYPQMLPFLIRASFVLLLGEMFLWSDAKVISELPHLEDALGHFNPDATQESEARCLDNTRRCTEVTYPALPPQEVLHSSLENWGFGVKEIQGYCFTRLIATSGTVCTISLPFCRFSFDLFAFNSFNVFVVQWNHGLYGK